MELLAPAGSFSSAIYALQNGADAVYVGLKQFSARNKAVNLSFDELRRLVQFARKSGREGGGAAKKVYITLNTIIRDSELPKVYELLYSLAYLDIDGVIIQDLGVLHMIREYFPGIPIHASTQTAAHSADGVRALTHMGCSRVILSRELTLEEITRIRKECPETELEVFIHGALCYGFSGVCLASSRLLGRSANRGVCGQICRTWFNHISEDLQQKHIAMDNITSKTPGYFFSMKDLELGREISELLRIGIDSIKIEGRMKSPEYSGTASRYYRSIIDRFEPLTSNQKAAEPDSGKFVSEIENHKQELHMLFSRSTSTGWLYYKQRQKKDQEGCKNNDRLVTTDYPSHRGVSLGRIISIKGRKITLQLNVGLSLRDGIHYFTEKLPERGKHTKKFIAERGKGTGSGKKAEDPGILEARPFAVTQMQNKYDQTVTFANSGETISIISPNPIPKTAHLYKISDHASHLPQIKPSAYPLYKRPLNIEFHFTREALRLAADFSWTEHSVCLEQTYTADIQYAKVKGKLKSFLEKTFESSGETYFSMNDCTVTSNASKETEESLDPEEIFIPPSQLKTIRRKWYHYLDSIFEEQKNPEAFLSGGPDMGPGIVHEEKSLEQTDNAPTKTSFEIPLRSSLYFASEIAAENSAETVIEAGSGISVQLPFLTSPGDTPVESIPAFKDNYYIPLAPVLINPEKYKQDLFSLIQQLVNTVFVGGEHIYLGLNNAGHIPIVRQAAALFSIQTFVDIYCYVANHLANKELSSLCAPAFAYYWIEDPHPPSKNLLQSWPVEIGFADKALNPPLFISRSCFKRDSLGISCRNCKAKRSEHRLEQNGRRYTVYSEDCISYIFADD